MYPFVVCSVCFGRVVSTGPVATMSIDSEAFFDSRMAAIGIENVVRIAMRAKGWSTIGSFAYSCGWMPGQGSDDVFVNSVLVALLGAAHDTNVNAPRLRRLFVECHTLAIQDLRRRSERTDDDRPVKLPVEERMARMQKLKLRLPGLDITRELDPSNALVDLLAQQMESGQIK